MNNLDQLAVNTIRILAAEGVQKANSGHPGMPMGMADCAYVLWTKYLKFNPKDPQWLNRDRFILSAGHGSMLLYSLLHLSGYDVALDDLKSFRQLNSRTPGHPEYGFSPGVETTTGPLGQGFANGIGMAIAAKMQAERFNTKEQKIFGDHYIYAIVSDGDLMEGVASEAASYAGYLGLGNIIYLYDDNSITIEGKTDLTYSEDVAKRFEAYGWHTIKIDGHNHEQIAKAIEEGQNEKQKPTLILAKTTIGFGSPNKSNTSEVHGSPLGDDELQKTKDNLGWNYKESFHIPEEVKKLFSDRAQELQKYYDEWNKSYSAWQSKNPDLAVLKKSLLDKSKKAFSGNLELDEVGRFRFRKGGEAHGFSPTTFKKIHNISQNKNIAVTDEEQSVYLRDFLEVKKLKPIQKEEVESAEQILKRFGLGAISFGAISEETHRTLARAATILGIRSNTGEGGEQKDRYSISNPDKSENCYTKQIASGRFGVTTSYLTAAREIQIKIGQGAKPGEGGQLPGEKVTLSIANNRHTTPSVTLISPPPHHDIYSIEDLAELIYDLKQVNPRANICVKLVSQFGIGIIASGVVKAGADTILISGNDGGTGASPLGSLKHTGLPWEIGLSEVHRTLTQNGLRSMVTLRIDGGLKNARDIIIGAMLGAEEYDLGTSALVAVGCVMARQCHLNTCPAGIATQDIELRKKFKGKPENLVNFIKNIAEEIRVILSEIGFGNLDEIIGRNDLLKEKNQYKRLLKEKNIDLTSLLAKDEMQNLFLNCKEKIKAPATKFEQHFAEGINEEVLPAIMTHGRAIVNRKLKNTDRAIGSRISGLISFLYGPGEFKGSIQYQLNGAAGQSLGAFLVDNIELRHCGVANDYVGKGMSGGMITIRFPRTIRKSLEGNTIIGNVALYGATGGEVFIAGKAGERFAVRNSGAAAVVEGVGNHCCEYMTRGLVIVLGETGKNFGAGMTGGLAFVYNKRSSVEKDLNMEYVKIDQLKRPDEDLIYKYLVNHEFHTGSTIAKVILENWEIEKNNFIKIYPRAIEAVDFTKIYDEQFNSRLLEVFTNSFVK